MHSTPTQVPDAPNAPSRLMAVLFVLSLVGYPIGATIATALGVDGRPISVFIRATFLGLSLLALASWILGRVQLYRTKFWIFFTGFWAAYALRIFYDVFIAEVPTAYPPEIYFSFLFGVTFIPSFAFFRPIDARTSKWALQWTLVALVGCQAAFLLTMRSQIETLTQERLQNEVLNAISLGALGGASVILGIYLTVDRLREGPTTYRRWQSSRWMVVLSTISIGLGFLTMFLSASRGPLWSILLCAIILIFRTYHFTQNRIGIVILFFLMVVALISLALPLAIEFGSPLLERVYHTARMEEMSDLGRLELWTNGWAEFVESPFLGSGFEVRHDVFYPHNLPLEALMSTGVLGGAFWIAMCGYGISRALRVLWTNPEYGWIGLIFLFVFSNGLLSGNLWNAGPMAHFMVALFSVPLASAVSRNAVSDVVLPRERLRRQPVS
jgi:hypothetical protein